MSFSLPYKQWQTARVTHTAPGDTLLTDYKPTDIDATIRDTKMISVHPATAVMLRAWGKAANNASAIVTISGWMQQPIAGSGQLFSPGHILWKGTLSLGARSMASTVPLEGGKWGAAATWFEVDTWTATVDPAGATSILTVDHGGVLLLPTLGYTHLLFEFSDDSGTDMTSLGIAWYPIRFQELVKTF